MKVKLGVKLAMGFGAVLAITGALGAWPLTRCTP